MVPCGVAAAPVRPAVQLGVYQCRFAGYAPGDFFVGRAEGFGNTSCTQFV